MTGIPPDNGRSIRQDYSMDGTSCRMLTWLGQVTTQSRSSLVRLAVARLYQEMLRRAAEGSIDVSDAPYPVEES